LAATPSVACPPTKRIGARIIQLIAATYRKMRQNLLWAVGYNVIALPLAAGALAWMGFVLPVWVGALLMLMSLSIIIGAVNAHTLRYLKLHTNDAHGADERRIPT